MKQNKEQQTTQFTALHLACIVLTVVLAASWALFLLAPRGIVDNGPEQVGGTYQNCNILGGVLTDYIVLDERENRYYFYQEGNPEETGTYTVDKLEAALTHGAYADDGKFYGNLDNAFYGYKIVCTSEGNAAQVTELLAIGDTLYRLRNGQMAPYAKTSTVTVFAGVDFSGGTGENA